VGNLAFYSGSDAETLRVVEWIGATLFALTLLLIILVLLLRAGLLLRERRKRKFLNVWQPILTNVVDVPSADVPHLPRRNLTDFLFVWNHLHQFLLDESKDHLNQIAYALRINEAALRMLRRRNLRDRLLAVITLGQLRERSAWDALLPLTRDASPALSIVAARALMMIDGAKAVPELIPLLESRPDWPLHRVANVLQLAGAEIISDPIARAAIASCMGASVESATGVVKAESINHPERLIRYLELAYNVLALPAVRTIAQSSPDAEVLAACLRLFKSDEDLEIVRRCLTHKAWPVRLQAAAAMGRIGEARDATRLIRLLSDEQWWVRYRAAQALARLPSMTAAGLKAIQAKQSDAFARDMLAQVIAEVRLQ
jgi:HEAT repeat protein